MKRIVFIGICFLSIPGYAQTLEVSGGYIINRLWDSNDDNPHWKSEYETGHGYFLMFAIEDIRFDVLRPRFSLAYENFDGGLYVRSGGLGGGGSRTVEFKKSLLTICIFPHGFTIKNKLDLHIGLQLSWLLAEEFTGSWGSWSIIPYSGGSGTIEDRYDHYNSAFYVGLAGRLAYNFKITESIYIFPQYSFYFGFRSEFRESPNDTKAMRHYFGIGIEKRLGKKTENK